MRINRLTLTNFRQHVDTRIELGSGITGIIGPNGSGKSTLLEAVAWALYGMQAARGNKESIRSYRAGPRAPVKVELDFDLGGHRYVVSRGLNSAEVYLDGSSLPIATSLSSVSELLGRRLGMTKSEFFHTYFTGQKELGIMAAMGPAERAQFLSRVLGYERLRTAQELARKRRSAIDSETKGLRAGMPEPEAVNRALAEAAARRTGAESKLAAAAVERERANAALIEITPQWERMQHERDVVQTLVAELRVAENERAARERDRERIQLELDAIAQAREERERLTAELAQLTALQTELAELERASHEEARHRTLTQTLHGITDELARLVERRTKVETAPALETETVEELARVRTEAEQAQAQFENANSEWVRDKQEAETKRQALIEQLLDVERQRQQILDLGESGICPICSRPLETHFRSVLDLLDSQIETITFNGKYFRSRIDQLATTPPPLVELDERRRHLVDQVGKLDRRLAKIQAAIQDLKVLMRDIDDKEKRRAALALELGTIAVQYEPARHAEVKRQVERLTPLAARASRLSAQVDREVLLVPELEDVRATAAEIDRRIVQLARKRSLLAFSEESFAAMRGQYDIAASMLRAAELTSVAVDAELGAARSGLAAAEKARDDLARAEATLAELASDRRLHEELDRAFGDIRTDLNRDLRPELSDRASRYIRELTDGRYSELELDDQYNVIVLEDAVPKPVISGGEEDLANLVLRLAISEMIAERAGQSFSLLILDEVFGSLDEARRHNVVDLLRRLQDRFEQVVLITHVESVREGLDRVIAVRYDEETGTSIVESESRDGAPELDLHAGAAD